MLRQNKFKKKIKSKCTNEWTGKQNILTIGKIICTEQIKIKINVYFLRTSANIKLDKNNLIYDCNSDKIK